MSFLKKEGAVSKKSFLFVANWKMVMTVEQTMQYVRDNISAMTTLAESTGNQIILCPSFPLIGAVHYLSTETPIKLGAQTCSSFSSGAYTGEVSAVTLAEFGCQYCIVGHSERRHYCHETDEDIARKVRSCLLAGITPILCIGEIRDLANISDTEVILGQQLSLLRDYLVDIGPNGAQTLLVAYEPVWAVGTGRMPEPGYLHEVYDRLERIGESSIPKGFTVRYLYGGSLNEKNLGSITNIGPIDGFLVGGSSLDFQKFKNMISLCV